MLRYLTSIIALSILISFSSCSDEGEGPSPLADDFDRKGMLEFWADQIIIPSYEEYRRSLELLLEAGNTFYNNPAINELVDLRNKYLEAYASWQKVSMFEIGKAEEIGFRNYTNIYPIDASLIQENIQNGTYNLELPSNFDAQGFPALDYLLYGLADTDQEIIDVLKDNEYKTYLIELILRLNTLTDIVFTDWENSYRDNFISNNGSSATASVDKMVNDLIFYYERFLRAGKIGIPAGVFSGSLISQSVEAPYSSQFSKILCLEGLETVERFFKGESHDSSVNGPSLMDYTDYITDINNTPNISSRIVSQWDVARTKINALDDSFKNQVELDNSKMLEAYDELQKAVILLKVDMLQALSIQVDFVDADGD